GWWTEDLKQAGEIVGPKRHGWPVRPHGAGSLVNGRRIEDFGAVRQQYPNRGKSPRFGRRERDNGAMIIKVLGKLENHWLEIQHGVGDMDRDDAIGLQVPSINCEGPLVSRCTGMASLLKASKAKTSKFCGDSASNERRASPRTT